MTTRTYKYHGAPEQRVLGALPEGDYSFVVASVDDIYESKAGNLVLPVKLTIQPQGVPVFANCWAGTDKNGDERDGIAEFLLCVNRVPEIGQEPNWKGLMGARGKCRLKVEIAQMGALAGKEVNKVAWFHRPKQVGPTTNQSQSFTPAEIEKSHAAIGKVLGVKDPDLDVEPDDIPF